MSLPARIEKLEAQAVAVAAVPCARLAVRTPADVVDLLAAEVEAVRRDARVDPVEKARTVGMLAAIALRAMDAAAAEGRLEAIERVLRFAPRGGKGMAWQRLNRSPASSISCAHASG